MNRWAISLVLGLALVGAAVAVFHQALSGWFFSSDPSDFNKRPVLAHMAQKRGYVEVRHYGHKLFRAVRENQANVYEGDSIRTGTTSHVVLNFESHYAIELEENGQFYLEHQGDTSVVILSVLRGKINVLQTGDTGQLQILENGFLHDPVSRFPTQPLVVHPNEGASETKTNASNSSAKDDSDTLSTDYIVSVIQGQKQFFNRCYAEHLQANPSSRGKMNFTFTIDPSGSVSEVKLVNATIQDSNLEKCVATVIERCRFRAFNARPIFANYPIVFE